MPPINLFYNFIDGFIVTLQLLSISIPLSITLGVLLGVLRVYYIKILSELATLIANTFRGLPLIVTLMILFYGLSDIKIFLSPFWAASTAFTLCGGSYISEYVKSTLESIDEGQSLAAKALGMSRLQEIIYITLPQAFKRALPSISNEIVYMIKYSSLASLIGVEELFSKARTLNSLYFKTIEIFTALAMIYLVLTTTAIIIFKYIENRVETPKT